MKFYKKLGLMTSLTLVTLTLMTSCSDSKEQPEVTLPAVDSSTTTPPVVPEVTVEPEEEGIRLNLEADFFFQAVDEEFQLEILDGEEISDLVFESDDSTVVEVSPEGLMVAKGEGSATVTVTFVSQEEEQTLSALVACVFAQEEEEVEETPEEEAAEPETEPEPEAEPEPTPEPEATPEPTPEPEASPEPEPEPEPTPEPEAPTSVDLASFYSNVTSSHQFGAMDPMSGAFLDNYYPGLTSVATKQCLVYIAQINTNAVEIGLVEVENTSDVDRVKSIFQSRISSQIDGGAWYPEAIESWQNQSTVTSNGNYVMIVVHPNHGAISSSFQGLF